jgi:hypothetical protein
MPYDFENESLDEGANGLIIPMPDGFTVRKKMRHGSRRNRGHDLQTQKRLHSLAARTLVDNNNFDILRTPYVLEEEDNPDWYVMERIQTDRPLWLGDPDSRRSYGDPEALETLERELVRFWATMWQQGFAPWDFELYIQRSGRVMMVDYDKWGFRRTDGNEPVQMPVAVTTRNFFTHPCFPPDFPRRLAEERGCQVPESLGRGTPFGNPRD